MYSMTTIQQSERGFDLRTSECGGLSRSVKFYGWQYISSSGVLFTARADATNAGLGAFSVVVTLAPADAISIGLELVRLGEQAQAEAFSR